jgi:hypothetical protein
MVRPMVPEDDLYARLELPIDASAEAVEIAWRSLLRRHHPDVAGGDGFAANDALERTKRINVAHDWLSDPDLRARYDRERVGPRIRSRSAASGRTSTAWAAAARDMPTAPVPSRPRPRRVLETEPTVRVPAFLERVARLTTDELDRLSMAQRQPIAFAATIRRFVPPALSMELERVEIALSQLVAPGRWSDLAIREALSGVAAELVLGPFLDENLTAAFRGRARERLIRSWCSRFATARRSSPRRRRAGSSERPPPSARPIALGRGPWTSTSTRACASRRRLRTTTSLPRHHSTGSPRRRRRAPATCWAASVM